MRWFPLKKKHKEKQKKKHGDNRWDLLDPFWMMCDVLVWPFRLLWALIRFIVRVFRSIFEFVGDLLDVI